MAEAPTLNGSFDSRAGRAALEPAATPEQQAEPPRAEIDPAEQAARDAFDRARAGHIAAFGLVARTYQDRLYNAVFRLLGNEDDAAEVTQEALTRGLEKLADFRGDSGPYTWLFRIATNAAVSRLRRSSRRRTVSLDALDAPSAGAGNGGRRGRYADSIESTGRSPAESAEHGEQQRAVLDALNRLDVENRALLVMRDLEGFDYRQMAEVLGLPLGTLKSRLFRARVALRELMQAEADPPGGGGRNGGDG